MNIVHVDFTGPFTDDAAYQENILPAINVLDGHNVTFLAENTKWLDGKIVELGDNEQGEYTLKNGVHIIRLKYKKIINEFFTNKIRSPIKLDSILRELKPDVIFVHCFQTWALVQICNYINNNKNVKLYIDSHTDKNNSARGFLSKYILHRVFYKTLAKHAEKMAEKIFYISLEGRDFLLDIYDIDKDKLEFMPLGGILISDETKAIYRKEFRDEHSISDNETVIIHAGKMDPLKRTLEILKFFERFKEEKLKLILVGALSDEIRTEALDIIQRDDRIKFLGWKTAEELEKCLCASDIYLQPGSQSATAQHALCCSLPVVLAKVPSYEIFVKQNGWLIRDIEELGGIFSHVVEEPTILTNMAKESAKIAEEYLDYRSHAKKFTS